jgi:hypothetical protein
VAHVDLTTAALHAAAVARQGGNTNKFILETADEMLKWLIANTDKVEELNDEEHIPVHGFFQDRPAVADDSPSDPDGGV